MNKAQETAAETVRVQQLARARQHGSEAASYTATTSSVNAAGSGTRHPRHKGAWVWFFYTAFLFINPVLDPHLYTWIGTLVVFAAFFVVFSVYVRCTDENGSASLWIIGATFALGLLTYPWNGGGSTFFVYAAAFLPFGFESLRRVCAFFLAGTLLICGEGYFLHSQTGILHTSWPDIVSSVVIMLIIGGGNFSVAQERRAGRKLRAALEENVALAAVAERERIARDLHDVLGHTLTVIALKAELAGRLIQRGDVNDRERAGAEIGDLERIARSALAEVREAIGGYRSHGFAAEIEVARAVLNAAGVRLIVGSRSSDANVMRSGADPAAGADSAVRDPAMSDSAALGLPRLSAPEETALSLALREAVTNIVRHAGATTCYLCFVVEDGRRRLVVEDDGQHAVAREGNGLRGMRERIESLGGQLSLEREHGTRLLIELSRASEGATQ